MLHGALGRRFTAVERTLAITFFPAPRLCVSASKISGALAVTLFAGVMTAVAATPDQADQAGFQSSRSEERRVGKECAD